MDRTTSAALRAADSPMIFVDGTVQPPVDHDGPVIRANGERRPPKLPVGDAAIDSATADVVTADAGPAVAPSPSLADADIVAELRGWIAIAALDASRGEPLLAGLGERLQQSDLAISRLSVAWRTLHPLIRAEDLVWTAGMVTPRQFLHTEVWSENYLSGPLRYIVENDVPYYRADLRGAKQPYRMFNELHAAGHTGYVGTIERFSSDKIDSGVLQGIFLSFCTNRAGGFTDAIVATMLALRPTIALGLRGVVLQQMLRAVADTYLGKLAADRVLGGAIRRGDAEVIPAAIWYSDLRAFTPMSEALTLDDTIAFLNEVFEATAGAVTAAGGQVLDFIGDAVLAIFPLADDGVARAIAALDDALLRLAALRAAHASHPAPAIATSVERGLVGIAIALGDVRFGNIGTIERLSFSVIGPTVNIVARIEGMTKILGEPVLVTEAFAAAVPGRFVSRGEHALEGISDRRELFGLAIAGPRA